MARETKTGRHRFRLWKGKLVLQVEVIFEHTTNLGNEIDVQDVTHFRDALLEDLTVDLYRMELTAPD